MEKEIIKIKDIIVSLKQIPKTIAILLRIDRKAFFLTILLSIFTGILPVITLILSQELINSLVRMDSFYSSTMRIFALYILALFTGAMLSELKGFIEGKFQFLLQYRLNYMVMEKCTDLALEDFETSEMYDKIEKLQEKSHTDLFKFFWQSSAY